MPINVRQIAGGVLMAGCGSALATQLGLTAVQTVLLAGLAVGIALLGQGPSAALRARVARLEAKTSGSSDESV